MAKPRLFGWRCDRGAGAVEFALLAPLVFGLLVGVLDFARVYQTKNEMTAAAREAVRRLATGVLPQSSVEDFVEHLLEQSTKAMFTIVVTEQPLGEGLGTDVTIAVSVPLTEVMMFYGTLLGRETAGDPPRMLAASATMLKQ